jgi:hypothetical protein
MYSSKEDELPLLIDAKAARERAPLKLFHLVVPKIPK